MADLHAGLGDPESDLSSTRVEPAPGIRDTVLIVSAARVTTTVIARIVTMAGLKSLTTDPGEIEQAAHQSRLAAIVLDDDAQLASLVADRAILGPEGRPAQRPFVILLASAGRNLDAGRESPHCDAVLAKPISSDTLYPLLFDIRQRLAQAARA